MTQGMGSAMKRVRALVMLVSAGLIAAGFGVLHTTSAPPAEAQAKDPQPSGKPKAMAAPGFVQVGTMSGNRGVYETSYSLSAGTVRVEYHMYTVPDSVSILVNGAQKASTGLVSGSGVLEHTFPAASSVTVKIDAPNSGTVWDLIIFHKPSSPPTTTTTTTTVPKPTTTTTKPKPPCTWADVVLGKHLGANPQCLGVPATPLSFELDGSISGGRYTDSEWLNFRRAVGHAPGSPSGNWWIPACKTLIKVVTTRTFQQCASDPTLVNTLQQIVGAGSGGPKWHTPSAYGVGQEAYVDPAVSLAGRGFFSTPSREYRVKYTLNRTGSNNYSVAVFPQRSCSGFDTQVAMYALKRPVPGFGQQPYCWYNPDTLVAGPPGSNCRLVGGFVPRWSCSYSMTESLVTPLAIQQFKYNAQDRRTRVLGSIGVPCGALAIAASTNPAKLTFPGVVLETAKVICGILVAQIVLRWNTHIQDIDRAANRCPSGFVARNNYTFGFNIVPTLTPTPIPVVVAPLATWTWTFTRNGVDCTQAGAVVP
jgi:hypothetical protein